MNCMVWELYLNKTVAPTKNWGWEVDTATKHIFDVQRC